MKMGTGKIFLAAGAVMLLLSGCRRTDSAVNILKEAVENSNKADSFSGKIEMDMGVGIEETGVSIGMDFDIDMDIEAVKEPGGYHMKGSIKSGFMELEDIEVYGIPDEDGEGFLSYVNVYDSWERTKSSSDEKDNARNLMNLENYIYSGSKLEMEEIGKENGREVYVITTTADAGELQTAGVILNSLFGDEGFSMDFKDASSKVTFKIYKNDRYPASVSMTLSGKDGEAFTAFSEGDGTFTMKRMDFKLTFEEYDTIKEIKVPEEALEARTDSLDILGDLEREDTDETEEPELQKDKKGNYILTDWDHDVEVSIPKPEGMNVDQYSDDTYLTFYAEGEKSYTATYSLETLYEASDEQLYIDVRAGMKDTYEATAGYSDVKYQEVKEIKAGNRKVKYVGLSFTYEEDIYSNAVWAWTIIDDKYMLICEIREYPDTKDNYAINEEVIQALFSGI